VLSPSVTHTGTNNLPRRWNAAASGGEWRCRVPSADDSSSSAAVFFPVQTVSRKVVLPFVPRALSPRARAIGRFFFPSSCPALNPSQFRPRKHRDSPRKNKRSIFSCQIPRGCSCRCPCLLLRPASSPPFRRAASDQASSRTRVYPLSHPQGRPSGPLRRHRCHGLSVRHHH